MKNAYCVSTEQHGNMKSGILWSKNSTSCKLGVIVHCLAQTCERLTIPTDTKIRSLCTFLWLQLKTSNIWHQRTRFFDQVPCFVKPFRISIYSATTGKKISCKLLIILVNYKKKQKLVFFVKHRVVCLTMQQHSLVRHCQVLQCQALYFALKIAARPLYIETWLLLTAYIGTCRRPI